MDNHLLLLVQNFFKRRPERKELFHGLYPLPFYKTRAMADPLLQGYLLLLICRYLHPTCALLAPHLKTKTFFFKDGVAGRYKLAGADRPGTLLVLVYRVHRVHPGSDEWGHQLGPPRDPVL